MTIYISVQFSYNFFGMWMERIMKNAVFFTSPFERNRRYLGRYNVEDIKVEDIMKWCLHWRTIHVNHLGKVRRRSTSILSSSQSIYTKPWTDQRENRQTQSGWPIWSNMFKGENADNIYIYIYMCVCVWVCMCVCVWEREREKEQQSLSVCLSVSPYIFGLKMIYYCNNIYVV